MIEDGTHALRPAGFREVCNAWVGQALGVERSFSTPDFVGVLQPLGEQAAAGGDAQAGVMMKAPPAPAFVMTEPEILLAPIIERAVEQIDLFAAAAGEAIGLADAAAHRPAAGPSPAGHSSA